MKPGKLRHELLGELLGRVSSDDPSVVVGPRVGEDAAVVALGERLLVSAMDPITFAGDLIGWYAVHVNANDIAVMGGAPRWFLVTLLLPAAAEETEVGLIFDQIAESCGDLGVTLIGGHTEVTLDIDRPILVGCMLGEVSRDALLTSAGARPGDAVILCGGVAIEGTAILAREAGQMLCDQGMARDSVERAKNLLFEPGISVLPAARAAAHAGGVTAMHDPTEGGIATGLMELALASGVGLEIDAHRVTVLPLTQEVCELLSLEPLGLIASGSLLVTARPEAAENVVATLRAATREVAIIGRATPEREGLWLATEGKREPLPEFSRDEVARFFDEKQGLR